MPDSRDMDVEPLISSHTTINVEHISVYSHTIYTIPMDIYRLWSMWVTRILAKALSLPGDRIYMPRHLEQYKQLS